MAKYTEKYNNRISVAIPSEEYLNEMNGLIASKKFRSKSEIIAKCVEIALPVLTGGARSADKPSTERHTDEVLKRQTSTIREVSIMTNIMFNLMCSLFKERALTLSGVHTNATDLENGTYETLPEHYQDVLNELLK